jgi:hypothetical protein
MAAIPRGIEVHITGVKVRKEVIIYGERYKTIVIVYPSRM